MTKFEANYGRHKDSVAAAPYVINGPADQRTFHKKLIKLQQLDVPIPGVPWEVYQRRLSLVTTVGSGAATSQNLLEGPRGTARSWNSNYGPHGWHRYVGRFPPHLVRALLNHFGAGNSDLVCDPFAGSGTTLVESRLLGIPSVGIEICPLSALIMRTKSRFPTRKAGALQHMLTDLDSFYSERWMDMRKRFPGQKLSHSRVLTRVGNLVPSFSNVEKWFSPEALLGVSLIVEFADRQKGFQKDALLTALSAKMRSIGNVDVDVVRAEYRKTPRENVDVFRLIQRQLLKMIGAIADAHKTHSDTIGPIDSVRVIEKSVLDVKLAEGSVAHVITSPPYGVESISYLRTHLLSYRSLSHFLNEDPYAFGDRVIGSEYLSAAAPEICELRVASESKAYATFFERVLAKKLGKNHRLRALMMMKFFQDMDEVIERVSAWIRPGGRVAFVVGNKKIASDVVPTDKIIIDIFRSWGFSFDTAVKHKLKTNNSNSQVPWQDRIISDEYMLLFTKASR